tara:strand:+ start:312 stop:734 length:423 start_codon:yes stop_codon:yes gene_type:complete
METLEKTLGTLQKEQNKMTATGNKNKNLFSSGTDFFGDKSYKGNSTKKCTPVSFYLVFMGIQIFMDFVNGSIINAIIKFPITLIFVTLLTILCQRDLTVMSWILVFIPFIFTTLISAFILDNIQTGSTSLQTDFINFNMV